jgi:Methylamine utilisation protein MauE
MPTVDLPLAVLLGGVFLIAGAGKLIHVDRFRESLESYRLAPAKPLLSWLVPLAELTVGGALIAGLRGAGWAAAGLLAAFSLALGVELATGASPSSCGCLVPGAGLPARLALIRNALLAAVALAVIAGARPRLGEAFWLAAFVALWLIVAGLGALVFALYRQVGVLHLRLGPRGAFEHDGEGLPLGDQAPPGTAGSLVVFTSPSCPVCAQIVPGLRAIGRDHALSVVHAQEDDAHGRELHRAFDVPGTPYAVYVGGDGAVRAKGTINTLEQLESVVVTGRAREREGAVPHAA